MSGFLHQLARRSLGLAPRLHRAAAAPYLAPPNLAVRDEWFTAAPADAATHPAALASREAATALSTLVAQAESAPKQAGAKQSPISTTEAVRLDTHRFDAAAPAAAAARPDVNSLMAQRPTHTQAAAPPLRPTAAPPPGEVAQAVLRNVSASMTHPQPGLPFSEALPSDAHASEPTSGEAHAHAHAPSPRRAQEWKAPAARAMPARAAAPDHHPVPDVHITIDRLEIAPPAPAPRAIAPPRSAALSLRDYLAARRAGQP